MKHIIGLVQATLACAVMVAMVFSVPLFAMAFPIHLDVSVSDWKQLLPTHRQANNKLPT